MQSSRPVLGLGAVAGAADWPKHLWRGLRFAQDQVNRPAQEWCMISRDQSSAYCTRAFHWLSTTLASYSTWKPSPDMVTEGTGGGAEN